MLAIEKLENIRQTGDRITARCPAPALGIDASVFSPAHPVRLPGVRHEKTGALSRLLYLDA